MVARQRHRQGDRQDRRRFLVLHHRRLRLRPCAREGHCRGGRGEVAARSWVRCALRSTMPISPLSCSRRSPRAPRSSGWPTPGADTTNAIKQAAEFGIVAGGQNLAGLLIFLTDVHALGLADRPGAHFHRVVLLGHQRCDAGLRQEVRGARRRRSSDDDPCRRLCRGDALSQGARGGGADADGKAIVDKMKELPTDDPLFGKGHHSRRRPEDSRHVSLRGQEAGRIEGRRGTITSCAPRFRPRKRSGRSTRAAAPGEVMDHLRNGSRPPRLPCPANA